MCDLLFHVHFELVHQQEEFYQLVTMQAYWKARVGGGVGEWLDLASDQHPS